MKNTLIISTYNRVNQLWNTLHRMVHLTKPDDILVVDDGGSDHTESLVNAFKDRLPIRYIYNHNPGWTICSLARNIGLKNTDADLIFVSEPEILFVTDVLKQMTEIHLANPECIVLAGTIYQQGEHAPLHPDMITNPAERLKQEIIWVYDTHGAGFRADQTYCKTVNWTATYLSLYRRDWLMEINGWDEGFQEGWGWDDTDLLTRLRIKNKGTIVANDVEAIHQSHQKNPSRGPLNEARFRAKNFHSSYGVEDPNASDLVANQGFEWGRIRPRT